VLTGLGAVFIPLCLLAWRQPPSLLALVFIGSAFGAAAALVFGGYGVMPGFVPAALFIAFVILKMSFGSRYPAEHLVLATLAPFILVVAGALLSSVIMPRLFEGAILVWPQKVEGYFVRAPLAPNAGNYTQDAYLLMNAVLTVTAALYVTQSKFDPNRLLNVYFLSGLMVVFISLWQFASNETGLWFPADFFLSNPGWAILTEESIGTLLRINGPFSEPSSLAGYLTATVSGAAWILLNGGRGRLVWATAISGTFIILLSTSTTGYAGLALMCGILVLATVVSKSGALQKRVIFGVCAVGAVVGIGAITLPAVAPGVTQQIVTITNATLNKQQSSSYTDRTAADHDSIMEMADSYGLGVGWGSNRSSSLIPGLCAQVGVWGLFGLLWFAVGLFNHVRIAQRLAPYSPFRRVLRGCSGAIIGGLVCEMISGPVIISPDFFLLVALLVGTAARIRLEARTAQQPVAAAQMFAR
jgi:hypothetical protein